MSPGGSHLAGKSGVGVRDGFGHGSTLRKAHGGLALGDGFMPEMTELTTTQGSGMNIGSGDGTLLDMGDCTKAPTRQLHGMAGHVRSGNCTFMTGCDVSGSAMKISPLWNIQQGPGMSVSPHSIGRNPLI